MSLLNFLAVLLSVLAAVTIGATTCPGNDNPPEAGGDGYYSCADQVKIGQCSQGWMQGYCECACGVYQYEEAPETVEMVPVPVPVPSTPEMVTAPQVEPVPATSEMIAAPEVESAAKKPTKKDKKDKKNRNRKNKEE